MQLSDAVPREAIEAKIGPFTEKVGFTEADSFIRNDKEHMSTLGLYVWDQMVARGDAKQPWALAAVYPHRLDKMAQFIKRELRRAWVTDSFTTKLYSSILPDYSFADIELHECYPGDLHIGDIEFSDVSRPLAKPSDGIGAREFHGLRVFGDFLDGVTQVAKSRGLDRISLIAGSPHAHDVFTRYGFKVGDGHGAEYAYRSKGFSHGMLLTI